MQHEAGGCSTAVSDTSALQCSTVQYSTVQHCSVWHQCTCSKSAVSGSPLPPPPLQQLPGSAAADEGVNEILRYFMFFMVFSGLHWEV